MNPDHYLFAVVFDMLLGFMVVFLFWATLRINCLIDQSLFGRDLYEQTESENKVKET